MTAQAIKKTKPQRIITSGNHELSIKLPPELARKNCGPICTKLSNVIVKYIETLPEDSSKDIAHLKPLSYVRILMHAFPAQNDIHNKGDVFSANIRRYMLKQGKKDVRHTQAFIWLAINLTESELIDDVQWNNFVQENDLARLEPLGREIKLLDDAPYVHLLKEIERDRPHKPPQLKKDVTTYAKEIKYGELTTHGKQRVNAAPGTGLKRERFVTYLYKEDVERVSSAWEIAGFKTRVEYIEAAIREKNEKTLEEYSLRNKL